MNNFAESNYIPYDEWFDANISPKDLVNYSNETVFSDSVHEKFYKLSKLNLSIGSSNNMF